MHKLSSISLFHFKFQQTDMTVLNSHLFNADNYNIPSNAYEHLKLKYFRLIFKKAKYSLNNSKVYGSTQHGFEGVSD